jgi:guanylate kinase
VQEALARGEDVLLKIEVQGAAMVKLKVPRAILIFLAPPDARVLEARIRAAARGAVAEADVQRRLAAVERELACIPGYDYLVVNHPGRLDEAVRQLETIIRAEHARVNVPPVQL